MSYDGLLHAQHVLQFGIGVNQHGTAIADNLSHVSAHGLFQVQARPWPWQ